MTISLILTLTFAAAAELTAEQIIEKRDGKNSADKRREKGSVSD